MGHWAKAKTALNAMSKFDTRGGVQKKDEQYKDETRIPQPSAPPPPFAIPRPAQSPQPHGENTPYYIYPPAPIQSQPVTTGYQQTYSVMHSPAALDCGHTPQQSHHYPSEQFHPASGFEGPYTQAPHFISPIDDPHGNPSTSYSQHSPPQIPQSNFTQANPGPQSPSQPYSSPVQAPQANSDGFHPQNSQPSHNQQGFSLDNIDPYPPNPYDDSAPRTSYAIFNTEQHEQIPSHDMSPTQTPHMPQRSTSEYNYQDRYVPRRSTIPPEYHVMHNCFEHWNNVLGRCLKCEPIP